MGKVYLVHDAKRPDQEFALKALSLENTDENFLECFKAEFEILAGLDHPHLAKVYDFTNRAKFLEDCDPKGKQVEFAQGAQYFFTAEYVPGKDLYAATEGLSWQEIARLMIPLCRALEYIHGRGIVHRDLKPGNILVPDLQKGILKVLDFGLARGRSERSGFLTRFEEQSPARTTIVGTLSYIAPEVIRGEPIDARADLYALGMLMYRVLTRTNPFSGLSQNQILMAHLSGVKTSPREVKAEIPRALSQIVMSLLSPRIEDRPASAGAVLTQIADLLGELAPTETVATSLGYVQSAKLVGRDEILKALNETVSGLQAGTGISHPFLVLRGEAGLGKRRLVREMERTCQLQAVSTFETPAYFEEKSVDAVKSILREVLRLVTEGGKPFAVSPQLQSFLEGPEREGADSEEALEASQGGPLTLARQISRSFEILTQALHEWVPLLPGGVLCFHLPMGGLQRDIQGDAAANFRLLEYLGSILRQSPLRGKVACVLTALPAALPPDVERILPGAQIFDLKPLSRKEVQLLLESMLATATLPDGLLSTVMQITSGNPLHIEEAMRSLVAENQLKRVSGKWTLSDASPKALAKLAVPRGIEETIGLRFQHLPEPERAVLEVLALMSQPRGESVALAALSNVLGWPLGKVLVALERAKLEGFVRDLHDYRFEFVSPTFLQVIDHRIADGVRKQTLHQKIAQYLAGQSPVSPMQMAFHLDRGHQWREAVETYGVAGEEASRFYAPQEALRFFFRATEILETQERVPADSLQMLRLREQVARHLGIVGELGKALEAYEALARLLEKIAPIEDPFFHVRVLRRLGHLYRGKGATELALHCYEKALNVLGAEASGPEGALLLVQIAGVKLRLGRKAQARRDCRFALRRIDAQRAPQIYANCYLVLGELEVSRGNLVLANEYFHRVLNTYERLQDREGITLVLLYLGSVVDQMGKSEEADFILRRAIREAQAIGEVQRVAMARNNLGNFHFRHGHYPEAMREYLEGVEAARKLGDQRLLATSLNNLGNVTCLRGSYGRALSYYQESLGLKKALGDPTSLCHTLLALCELELKIGDLKSANARIQEALGMARDCGARILQGKALLNFAILARLGGDVEMMDRRLTDAEEIFRETRQDTELASLELERLRYRDLPNRDRSAYKKLRRILAFAIEKEKGNLECEVYMTLGQFADLEKDGRENASLGSSSLDLGATYLRLAVHRSNETGNLELEWEGSYRLGMLLKRSEDPVAFQAAAKALSHARDILLEISASLPKELQEMFLAEPLRKSCLQEGNAAVVKAFPAATDGASASVSDVTSVMGETHLEKLLEINKQLNAVHEVDPLLEHILDTALNLLQGERGFIVTVEREELSIKTAREISRRQLRDPQNEISMSIARKVILTGKPVVAMDAQNAPEFRESVSVHALQLRSVLCVPLRVQDQVLGALYVDNPRVRAMFTDEDSNLLMSFADQAALALDQARMRAELNQQLERTQTNLAGVRRELDQVKTKFSHEYRYAGIVGGKDPAMKNLFALLKKVAKGTSPVLILGESGSGKELVARAIHSEGPLAKYPFLGVNCAAFPETLLESELFGHESGAFTGANQRRIGLFEAASGGTIFLDEIGEMPPAMQAKLLRVLESGEMRRLGGNQVLKVNVRVISATHRDLATMMREGKFRQDLLYRINTITLHLPALRERPLDFSLIVESLLKGLQRRFRSHKVLAKKALRFLEKYPWPGNVRELANVLERAYTLAEGRLIGPDDLPEEILEASVHAFEEQEPLSGSFQEIQSKASRAFLEEALRRAHGNVSRASRESGIPRGTFYRLMYKHGVRAAD